MGCLLAASTRVHLPFVPTGILTCPVLPHVCPSRLVCLFWETSPEVKGGVLSVALCHLPGAWDIVDPLRAVLIGGGPR